jgi:hypothetical protein
LLSQGFSVINSLIQSLILQEGSIGDILQVQKMMGKIFPTTRYQ